MSGTIWGFPEDIRIGEEVDSKSIAPQGVAGSSPVSSAGKRTPREHCVTGCFFVFVDPGNHQLSFSFLRERVWENIRGNGIAISTHGRVAARVGISSGKWQVARSHRSGILLLTTLEAFRLGF